MYNLVCHSVVSKSDICDFSMYTLWIYKKIGMGGVGEGCQ